MNILNLIGKMWTAGCEMMILIAILAMMVSIWIILIAILMKLNDIFAEIKVNRIMEKWKE